MSTSSGIIVAVVGSRSFLDYDRLTKCLDKIPRITKIVSGGARGADSLGAQYAQDHNIPLKVHKPDWNKHGKSAGPRRNRLIIADADYIIAFWNGKSRGTAHTIRLAKESGTPGIVYKH